jgi:membrane-associated phospholipid phosphatase
MTHGAAVRVHRQTVFRAVAFAGALGYLIAISWYLLLHGGWPTPDYLIPPLLLVAVAIGKGWPFLLDWGPFLLLVLSWQATADLAYRLGRPVHVTQPAAFDWWLFHDHLPSWELQRWLFDPDHAHWYDWVATAQHGAHFLLPVAAGMFLWLRGRRLYWRYLCSLMTVFYIGFAGYVLYPAAPPWMAAQQQVIPPVQRVISVTLGKLTVTEPIGLAYNHLSGNPVAAIPSLHAAVPVLIALVLVRLYGWRAAPAFLYPLAMGFNLVYLGEHYVVDVLAGYAVGAAGYLLVWVLPDVLHVRVPAQPWPAWQAPARLRYAGDAVAVAVAVVAVLVIGSSLHLSWPGRSHTESPRTALMIQAVEPAPAVRAPFQPLPCDAGRPDSPGVDDLLAGVAAEYSVYLISPSSSACYALARAESLPPVDVAAAVAYADSGLDLRVDQATSEPDATLALAGMPGPLLVEAGVPAGDDYVLVVMLDDVTDTGLARQAVHQLASLTLGAA